MEGYKVDMIKAALGQEVSSQGVRHGTTIDNSPSWKISPSKISLLVRFAHRRRDCCDKGSRWEAGALGVGGAVSLHLFHRKCQSSPQSADPGLGPLHRGRFTLKPRRESLRHIILPTQYPPPEVMTRMLYPGLGLDSRGAAERFDSRTRAEFGIEPENDTKTFGLFFKFVNSCNSWPLWIADARQEIVFWKRTAWQPVRWISVIWIFRSVADNVAVSGGSFDSTSSSSCPLCESFHCSQTFHGRARKRPV